MKIQYIVIMIFGKLLSEFGNVFGVGIKSEHLIDKAEEPCKIGIFFFDKQINPRTRIALAKRFEQGDRQDEITERTQAYDQNMWLHFLCVGRV